MVTVVCLINNKTINQQNTLKPKKTPADRVVLNIYTSKKQSIRLRFKYLYPYKTGCVLRLPHLLAIVSYKVSLQNKH